MKRLEGRVAIVTGAGRGLGRAHALTLAELGARVVVNDLGAGLHGEVEGNSPARDVVAEIEALGGHAVASGHDVSDWGQAGELVRLAVETFGDLHVLVNNAGILRDRALFNMEEAEWDAVIRVHLKGHAATSRHALAYWREQAKAGREVKASAIHTSSTSGYAANFGQANYGAAKLGIVALSAVIALEGAKYGVRSNAVAPSARTRMSLSTDDEGEIAVADGAFDRYDPAHVSQLIAWLAAADCPANGQIYHVYGGRLSILSMPPVVHRLEIDGPWTQEYFDQELPGRLVPQPDGEDFFR